MTDQNNEKLLSDLEEKQKLIDRVPFKYLKIDNSSCLVRIKGREICAKCFKSLYFFGYPVTHLL